MAMTAKDFYRSSNGDRWQLIRNTASGRSFVRHEPNLSSGGRTTDTDVEEFLNRSGSSPENLALRALLDKQTRMDPELVREANRKARTRPGDNSSHDPQFLVAANQADPAGRVCTFDAFTSGSARFGAELF